MGNIWNGEETTVDLWPWVVAFQYFTAEENKFFCAGSLVSDKHIVSAAHCFQEKFDTRKNWPGYVTALIGKQDLSSKIENEEGSEAHRVFNVILHEDWNFEDYNYDADISLVVLETRVDLSKRQFVRIVCLPPVNLGEVSGTGTLVSWGISENSGYRHENMPKKLSLPAVSQSQCYEADKDFEVVTSNRTFCAGYINQGKSSCGGDSGGGFYIYNDSTRAYILAGISSASLIDPKLSPCRTDTYSIFTDVGKFSNWIEEKMNETEEIKWKPVEFECSEHHWNDEDEIFSNFESEEFDTLFNETPFGSGTITKCISEFTGPFSPSNKIHQHYANAEKVENLLIILERSEHILAGIGENFPNLKNLLIISENGAIKFIESYSFKKIVNLQILYFSGVTVELLQENVFSDLKNLKKLGFFQSQVNYLLENVFSNLTNLNYLRLSDTQIRKLPSNVFSNLSNLRKLLLNNNEIKKLPINIFSNCLSLEILWLHENQISDLPENVFGNLSNLTELKLYSNKIKTLPIEIFSNLSNLKILLLFNNQIKNLHDNMFSSLKDLIVLDLDDNQIQNVSENIFSEMVNLKSLWLSKNQIKELPENIFFHLSNLRSLMLNNNQIKELPERAFSNLQNLESLMLYNNKIKEIPKNIFLNLSSLNELNLNDNPIKNIYANLSQIQHVYFDRIGYV